MTSIFAFNFLFFFVTITVNFNLLKKFDIHLERDTFITAAFLINAVTYQIYTSVYMVTVYAVYLSLTIVNDFLADAFESKNDSKEVLRKLKIVANLVDKVCDSLEPIKICFTVNLTIYVLHYSLFSTFSIFGTFATFFRSGSSDLDQTYSLITLMWQMFFSPFFVWVFLLASWIKQAGKEIETKMLKNLHENCHTLKVYKRTELVIMQLKHRRPLITCGVFVVDGYLLFHLMVLCSSYLIIIAQFEWKTF